LITRCISKTGLWEPVVSCWPEPFHAFQEMPCGKPWVF